MIIAPFDRSLRLCSLTSHDCIERLKRLKAQSSTVRSLTARSLHMTATHDMTPSNETLAQRQSTCQRNKSSAVTLLACWARHLAAAFLCSPSYHCSPSDVRPRPPWLGLTAGSQPPFARSRRFATRGSLPWPGWGGLPAAPSVCARFGGGGGFRRSRRLPAGPGLRPFRELRPRQRDLPARFRGRFGSSGRPL